MERSRPVHLVQTRDNKGVIEQYADLFVQRFDTYTRQRDHSRSYYRVRDRAGRPVPLSAADLGRHLRGEITIGLYGIDTSGLTKWSVVDSDDGIAPLQVAQEALATRDVPSYLEASRTGGHLWIFWLRRLRPTIARRILSPFSGNMEVFPAGDIPDEDGLGLCIRAPLGVHRLTMEYYGFLTRDLAPVRQGSRVRGQITWLTDNVCRADPNPLIAATYLRDTTPAIMRGGVIYPIRELSPITRFLAEHSCRDVIGQYVEINYRGVGHCPWADRHLHGDRYPSFQVFDATNRWWCYAERRGGNAFDFLCHHWQSSPSQVLERLGTKHARSGS